MSRPVAYWSCTSSPCHFSLLPTSPQQQECNMWQLWHRPNIEVNAVLHIFYAISGRCGWFTCAPATWEMATCHRRVPSAKTHREWETSKRGEDKCILCGEAKSFEQHLLGSFELGASSHTYGSISMAESRLSIECETQSQWHTLWQWKCLLLVAYCLQHVACSLCGRQLWFQYILVVGCRKRAIVSLAIELFIKT